jgi:transcriptional regulator with XRE-family HTH domain
MGEEKSARRSELARLRKSKGYSQEALADVVGVGKGTVCAWETGASTPRPENRLKLAVALKVSLSELERLMGSEPSSASSRFTFHYSR